MPREAVGLADGIMPREAAVGLTDGIMPREAVGLADGIMPREAAVGPADGNISREAGDGAKVMLTREGEGAIVLGSDVDEQSQVVENSSVLTRSGSSGPFVKPWHSGNI